MIHRARFYYAHAVAFGLHLTGPAQKVGRLLAAPDAPDHMGLALEHLIVMSNLYDDANDHSDLGKLSKPNEYELTTKATSIGGPTTPATTSVKKQKRISWLLCSTVGCVINFILLTLTVSCLAYYLSKCVAIESEVSRISQMLGQISEPNKSTYHPGGMTGK